MEGSEQPTRRPSLLRLLAAALAGAIGTFGVPAAAHARTPVPGSTTPTAVTAAQAKKD
jgi:hypothetical protein